MNNLSGGVLDMENFIHMIINWLIRIKFYIESHIGKLINRQHRLQNGDSGLPIPHYDVAVADRHAILKAYIEFYLHRGVNRGMLRVYHRTMVWGSPQCGFFSGETENNPQLSYSCFGTCGSQACPLTRIISDYITVCELRKFGFAVNMWKQENKKKLPPVRGLPFVKHHLIEGITKFFEKEKDGDDI